MRSMRSYSIISRRHPLWRPTIVPTLNGWMLALLALLLAATMFWSQRRRG